MKYNRWTDEELVLLKDNYQNLTGNGLLELLPRHPIKSIRTMAQKKLKVARVAPSKWLQEEITLLERNYALPLNELQRMFPRHPWRGIRSKAYLQGFKRPRFNGKKVRKLSIFEKGWLSAIIDGEGSITLNKGSSNIIAKITIANTSRKLIQRVKRIAGSGSIFIDKMERSSVNKPCYSLTICAIQDILALLKQLEPHLIVKKEQAKLVIEFCNLRLKNYHYTKRDYELIPLLKKLNLRGKWHD